MKITSLVESISTKTDQS